MTDMRHMDYLDEVSSLDLKMVRGKEATYQGSWKRRGGIGAFMMLARKWDRIEFFSRNQNYDIIKGCVDDVSGRDGTLLAEVRDLRAYLLLVEAEVLSRVQGQAATERYTVPVGGGVIIRPGTPEDGGHHGNE